MVRSPLLRRFEIFLRTVPLALLIVLLLAVPAAAQQTGTLTGLVHDAQGGVLPGVTVTATSDSLIGGSRTRVTAEAGSYQFDLPPGTYTPGGASTRTSCQREDWAASRPLHLPCR
jgi:hypothetical protein